MCAFLTEPEVGGVRTREGVVDVGVLDHWHHRPKLLFVDDAPLECCAERAAETGLAVTVAGGAHPLIKHAPVTSIPESPTLGFLLFAREYTAFRRRCFNTFAQRLDSAIPEEVEYQLRPLFPLLHVEFASEELAARLTAALVKTYSLITIDAEPQCAAPLANPDQPRRR